MLSPTSNISSIWELVRNENSQPNPGPTELETLECLTSTPSDSEAQ